MTDLVLSVQRYLQPDELCRVAVETRFSKKKDGKERKKTRFLAIICHEDAHEFGLIVLKKPKKLLGQLMAVEAFPFYRDLQVKILADIFIEIIAPWANKAVSFQLLSKAALDTFICDVSSFSSSIRDTSKSAKKEAFFWLSRYNDPKDAKSGKAKRPMSLLDVSDIHSDEFRNMNIASGQESKEDEVRDDIKIRFLERQADYTDLKDFRITVCTWNVNSKLTEGGLFASLLKITDNPPPDIIVVGLQEIDMSAEAVLLNDVSKGKPWESLLTSDVNSTATKYDRVASKQLAGVFMIVFLRKELVPHLSSVQVDLAAVGIMGLMGNKGGIAIRFKLFESTLCFLNSHLAAHQENFQRRNEDFHEISRRIRFVDGQEEFSLMSHDIHFWLGDLNYRINLPDEIVRKKCAEKAFNYLWDYDQLCIQRRAGNAFADYEEAPLSFPPTYKYDPGTDNYDTSEKKRIPAYCDRILWKSGSLVENIVYRPGTPCHSDHKPVLGVFIARLRVVDEAKRAEIFQAIARDVDKSRNELMPDTSLSCHGLDFGDVTFGVPVTKDIELVNTGSATARFRFLSQHGDKNISKPWLSVHPKMGTLPVGAKVKLSFTVLVTNATSPLLNSGKDKLEDILILSMIRGKHHFLTISGKYLMSCFGMSLEELVRIPQAVRTPAAERKPSGRDTLEIPKELWRMVDYLQRHGLGTERIFAESGDPEEMKAVCNCLDLNQPFPAGLSPHSVAEALTSWLQSLVEPVIPTPLYMRCLGSCTNGVQLKQILTSLPRLHHNTFVYIISFLRVVLQHSDKNKVTADELAMIFGNVLLRPPSDQEVLQGDQELSRKRASVVWQMLNAFMPLPS